MSVLNNFIRFQEVKVENNILDVNWLVQLDVNLACINNVGKATRFPARVRQVILDKITSI